MVPIPLVLSWDSLFASGLLGFSQCDSKRRLRLAGAFGVADAVASMLAPSPIIAHPVGDWLLPFPFVLVSAYLAAMLVILYSIRSKRIRGLVYLVPILLSLDNLLTPQIGSPSVLAILVLGIISAAMSLTGFAAASFIKKAVRRIFASPEDAPELAS